MSMRKMHRLISRLRANARNKWSIWMRPVSSCCFSGEPPYKQCSEQWRSSSDQGLMTKRLSGTLSFRLVEMARMRRTTDQPSKV